MVIKRQSLLVFGLLVIVSLLSLAKDFPDPKEAGFHHCALIYEGFKRDTASFKPYLVRMEGEKPTATWLFDSFLFLTQFTSTRRHTEVDATDKNDWLEILDRFFTTPSGDSFGDLGALERAISDLITELKVDLPQKRRVIIVIPWLNPACTDFGDINNDGKSENLANKKDRELVLKWFINEVKTRWEKANYKHLELWGFYWMREDIASDTENIRLASRLVHEAGYKMLWIPYYKASGWQTWQECGLDVAIMQPNLAFSTWLDGGNARRDRLRETADLAKNNNMGVEIEVNYFITHPHFRQVFLEYLRDGYLYGYQKGATAYFLGGDFIQKTYNSSDKNLRELYDILCAYILGEEIKEPTPVSVWNYNKENKTLIAETKLDTPTRIALLDIYFDLAKEPFYGFIQVETKANETDNYQVSGWAIRTLNQSSASPVKVVTVPVQNTAQKIRVICKPFLENQPEIEKILLDTTYQEQILHQALDASYQTVPSKAGGIYPDASYKLTDGLISKTGFVSGLTVGWNQGTVALNFDLKKEATIEKVVVHTQGGSYAAVNWPKNPVMYLSNTKGQYHTEGIGALPQDIYPLIPSEVKIVRTRSPIDADGTIEFRPLKLTKGRYLTFTAQTNGWLMLSEVEIYLQGEASPLKKVSYTTKPLPTAKKVDTYPDNGLKLTDGIIATGFTPALITGFNNEDKREYIIDLQEPTKISVVKAWCLDGGLNAIFGPEKITVSTSNNKIIWHSAGSAFIDKPATQELDAASYTLNLKEELTCRYVKIAVWRKKGWAMLSEIEIQ